MNWAKWNLPGSFSDRMEVKLQYLDKLVKNEDVSELETYLNKYAEGRDFLKHSLTRRVELLLREETQR